MTSPLTTSSGGISDAQLFGGEQAPIENARMVLRILKTGTFPNQPRDHETNWHDLMESWGDTLAEYDYEILERAARSWVKTYTDWPQLATFKAWCAGRLRERIEDERAATKAAPCSECGGDHFIAVRAGTAWRDPTDGLTKVATSSFAYPCGTCPDMANRHRLWCDGHFDLDHEICGRCREYRDPQPPSRAKRR